MHVRSLRYALTAVAVGLFIAPRPAAAQSSEYGAISQAYAALAQGRAAEAARLAEGVLTRAPRDHAAATVAVLAGSATGASAGLDAYERWLGASRHEDAFVLEPVARAVLSELATSRSSVDEEAKRRLASSAETAAAADNLEGQRLARELARPDPANPAQLMRSLGRTGYAAGASSVVPLLGHAAPDVRAVAAETLGLLGATGAISALQAGLKDPASEVRAAVAMALHRLGDTSGDEILSRSLTSGVPDLQIQAADAMANDPPSSWAPYLEPLLASEDPMTRLHAARLLLAVHPERAGPVLLGLLDHPNPVVAGEMAKTVVDAGLKDLPTIRHLLRHRAPEARLQGATALLRLIGVGL